jgi:hypothetical protein
MLGTTASQWAVLRLSLLSNPKANSDNFSLDYLELTF